MNEKLRVSLKNEHVKHSLSWLDSRQSLMLEKVIDWSKVNSGSRNMDGLKRMEKLIVEAFMPLNAEIEFIDLEDTETVMDDGSVLPFKNARTIRIAKRQSANKRVLMTGHYDTVFPHDSSFNTPKWLDDNTLNGPGVADMKGGILVLLNALMAFEQQPQAEAVGWEVLLSPDEETGSLASAKILKERAQAAHIGMTYEPAFADGTLAGERKGSGNYTVIVRGRAAHAGREFYEGRNAVVLLAKIISELSSLTGGRPELTVNPAVIQGGSAPNVVPDLALCRFNVRLKEPDDASWFEERVGAIIREADQKEGFSVHLHGGINRPPKALSSANIKLMSLVKECGESLGLHVDYVATGGCCEGNNLAAAGLPNVDTLGVRGGKIHSADEFLLVDSLSERAKLSFLILNAFAEGALDSVIEDR